MRNREVVLSELKFAVAQERQSTTRVLRLLKEVEADRHFVEMGYSSLFEFATQELKYSRSAAQRRIEAMRLSLCVASQTQGFFKQEDQRRKENGKTKLEPKTKREIIQSMLGASTRECERKLADISPEAALPKEKTQALPQGKTLIQFVASPELMEKLEKLKGLLAHQNFEGRHDQLIELLADLALKRLEPKRPEPKKFESSSLPAPVPQKSAKARTRYIPIPVRRAVWHSDQSQCTFEDPVTGKRCSSRHGLQFDHVLPFSLGGPNTVENLRLRCGIHNRYAAEKMGLFRHGVIGRS